MARIVVLTAKIVQTSQSSQSEWRVPSPQGQVKSIVRLCLDIEADDIAVERNTQLEYQCDCNLAQPSQILSMQQSP